MRKFLLIPICIFTALNSYASGLGEMHKMEFKEISDNTTDRDEQKILARAHDPEFPDAPLPTTYIAKYDLNGDGVKEFFVFSSGPLVCGAANCSMQVMLLDKQHGLKPVLSVASSSDIYVLDSTTKRFHDIAFPSTKPDEAGKYIVWKWDGKEYNCCN